MRQCVQSPGMSNPRDHVSALDLLLGSKEGQCFHQASRTLQSSLLVNSLPPCDGLHVSVFPVLYPCAEEGLRSKPRPRERSLEDKGPLKRKWFGM